MIREHLTPERFISVAEYYERERLRRIGRWLAEALIARERRKRKERRRLARPDG